MAESFDRDRPTVGSMPWVTKLAFVWGGELVSVLTSSILQMGFVWHITLTTNSASMLSLASLAGFLPLALFGMFAGTIVDRLPRRHAPISVQNSRPCPARDGGRNWLASSTVACWP